jgi:hypothetical protein
MDVLIISPSQLEILWSWNKLRSLKTTIDSVGFEHMQHIDFINTFAM